jgi:hypothetical protein
MYYIIEHSSDEKIIGTDYPQVHNFIKGYKENAPFALDEFYECKRKSYPDFPDFIPDLGGMRLSGRAKLTDWLSTSFGLALISPKFREILEKFNLCPYRFYPVTLYVRNVPYNYFYLHIISDYSDFVDYKKSTFLECTSYENREYIYVESKEDMLRKREEIENLNKGTTWTIWSDKIVMNSKFNRELDFFVVSRIDANRYISERLKNEITKNNFTGLDFITADKLNLSSK